MTTEAVTCRRYVLSKLDGAGWNQELHSFSEQKTFTDVGQQGIRVVAYALFMYAPANYYC